MEIARRVRRRIGVASAVVLLATAGAGASTVTAASDTVEWGPVVDLTPVVEAVYSPKVVPGHDGSVIAVWIGHSWERGRVHLRQRTAAGEWQPREVVPGTRGAAEVAVGADRDGALVLAWTVAHRVEVSRREVGEDWAPARVLHRTPSGVLGTRPAELALAVGPRGQAVVAWETRDDDQDGVYARSRIQMAVAGRNGAWRAVRTAAGDGWHPEVGVASSGRATVAWLQRVGRLDAGVTVSVHRPGAGWRTRSLTRRGEHAGWPQLTVSAAGTAVAWTFDRGGRHGVAARRWWPQHGWTTVRRTDEVPARGAWLNAGMDDAGDLTLASARWDGPLRVVDLTRGGRWSDGVRIGGPVRDLPTVVTNGRGDVVVGWPDGRGDSSRLQVAVRPAGGDWVRGDLDPELPAAGPVLVVDDTGRAVAAWVGRRGVEEALLRTRSLTITGAVAERR